MHTQMKVKLFYLHSHLL